jgi:hypothetical protein
MSSTFQKPTLAKPVAAPVPAGRPVAAAPKIIAPVKAPQQAPDPFADIPTSGIPFDKAMEMGLKGSQQFGFPLNQAQPAAAHVAPVGEEEQEVDWFTGEEPAAEAAEEDPDTSEDWNENEPEEAQAEEIDPFAEVPQTPAAPAHAVPTLVKPTAAKSAAVVAPKKFKLLQENDSVVFDNKLTHDLSTVKAAEEVWHTLRKPYQDMTKEEKYTCFHASQILVRDREKRYAAARMLANAILDVHVSDEPPMLDGVEATLLMGKGQPQTQGNEGLGQSEPSPIEAPRVQRSPMMDVCQNRATGCQSMRLNHLQGTQECVLPTCPCKGQCRGFVEAWRADPVQGGEAAQEGMKSPQPVAQSIPSATSQVPSIAGSAGEAGRTVGAIPARPVAVASQPTPSPQKGQAVAAGGQSTQQGQPVASGVQPAAAPKPVQPTPAPAPVNAANALQRAGAVAAGSGGSGQGVRPTAAPVPAQTGLQQVPGSNQAGVRRPDSAASTQPTPVASGRGQGQVEQGVSGGTGGVSPEQNAQAVAAGSGQAEQTVVTPDRLHWIMATGGNGPDHSDFWPIIPQQNMRAEVVARRMYAQGKAVDFYTKAFAAKPHFNFASNSYRVILAASTLSAAIEEYAISGQALPAGANDATEKELYAKVGKAAQDYVAAHEPLPAGQIDVPWSEYAQYCEVFKDAGLKVGMSLHEFQASQQTQG